MNFKLFILCALISYLALSDCYTQCDPVTLQIENNFRSNTSSDKGYNAYSLNYTDYYLENSDTLIDLAHIKSIWFGGIEGTNLRMAAGTSRSNPRDFFPGPLNATTGRPYVSDYCHQYPKIWKFTQEEIYRIKDLFDMNALMEEDLSIYIKSYPAKNNKWYQEVFGISLNEELAPFYDNDGDGNYDPLKGDYPIPISENPNFIPYQFTYSIYNDVADQHTVTQAFPVHVEIQQITYLLSDLQDAIKDNTLFTRFIWSLKGPFNIKDASIGIYELQDLDVGIDDYFGIDTLANSWYIYNSDEGIDQFTGSTHIRFTTCLNNNIDKFMVYNNGSIGTPQNEITEPNTAQHFYNYMKGLWKDGTKLTIGGNGYNQGSTLFTNYVYHDLPKDSQGWSMMSADIPFGGFTTISSFELGDLVNGDSGIIDLADVIVFDSLTSGIDKVCNLKNYSNQLESFYNEVILKKGSTATLDKFEYGNINIYPNPASSVLHIDYMNHSEIVMSVGILDAYGRTVLYDKEEFYDLDISMLQAGTYYLNIKTSYSNYIHRFVKI